MSRQPNAGRVAEYDRLRRFCSDLLEYLKSKYGKFSSSGPLPDFWRAGHPFSDSLSGLKQAMADFLEMTRGFTVQEQQEAGAYLSEREVVTLTDMRRQIWQLIPKILKRGKIRNDEEYYLLKKRAISLDDPEMNDETKKLADRLLHEYEFKTSKPTEQISSLAMEKTAKIIPWTCHSCGRKFDTLGGGVCRKCNKPTCMLCFGLGTLHRIKSKKSERIICKQCAKSEEVAPS